MPSPYDFEVLEHTADVGLVARGHDLAEAFAAAAWGLSAIMVDLSHAEPLEEREIEVTASDLEGLLVAWLSELLYLFDAEGFLACWFDVQQPALSPKSPEVARGDSTGRSTRLGGATRRGESRAEGIDSRSLRARVRGDRFDLEKHPSRMMVKAVTYHQLRVQWDQTGWEVQVIFDV